MLHAYTFTIQKNSPMRNRIGHSAILLIHTSLFPYARKPATKPLGPTPPLPPNNAALSRRRSENKPPHVYNATPTKNNPSPTTYRVTV